MASARFQLRIGISILILVLTLVDWTYSVTNLGHRLSAKTILISHVELSMLFELFYFCLFTYLALDSNQHFISTILLSLTQTFVSYDYMCKHHVFKVPSYNNNGHLLFSFTLLISCRTSVDILVYTYTLYTYKTSNPIFYIHTYTFKWRSLAALLLCIRFNISCFLNYPRY